MDIKGHVAPGFERVKDAFARNFAEGLEQGAAFSAFVGDDLVVELSGGWRDRAGTLPWELDTLSTMYSTSKTVMSVLIAMLVDRGLLDYDKPVAMYWPEFAAQGKGDFTLAQVLSHQCGLCGFLEPFDRELWLNSEGAAREIAKLKPMFRPGEGTGYHPSTLGFIVNELARRVDGRTLGVILGKEIRGPLGIDYFIGTPVSEHHRIAEGLKPDGPPEFGPVNDAMRAAYMMPWSTSDRERVEWRTGENPSTNGIGTATGTARLLSPYALKGRIGPRRLFSEATWRELTRERVRGPDRIQPGIISWAAGVQRNSQPELFGANPHVLGQTGWGGCGAFADPDRGFSAAYLMNRKGTHQLADKRRARLVDALYACL